jgi:pimeloyl-ACP methyl ester carboxylesterase
MNELFVDTPFGRVFAMAAGDPAGGLVLGLHGWSRRNGWRTWQPLLEPLAAAGHYAVSVDMPGWGRSEAIRPEPLDRPTALAVVLALLDALRPGAPAALMGKSWGGDLALGVALDHPERVSKLILTAPAFSDFGRLPELRQPVLLAWADDDPVIPIRFVEQYRAAPSLQLVAYPTGGHSAAMENAADFAPKAVQFLAGSATDAN